MKIPVIVTTARTGAAAIGYELSHIAETFYGSKNDLGFLFNVNNNVPYKWKLYENDGKLTLQRLSNKRMSKYWKGTKEDERLARLEVLKKFPEHTFRVLPEDIQQPEIWDYILANHEPMFLERRNKLRQFVSYCAAVSNNGETEVESITYDPNLFDDFVNSLEFYYKLKASVPNAKVIYYDQWQTNHKILFKMLGHKAFDIITDHDLIKPTNYKGDIFARISNKEEFEKDREQLILWLSHIDSKYKK